jgi:hypothetical protein
MATLNGLPLYKMTIDETDTVTGVEFISLVDDPAIEVNWLAFSKNPLKLYAASADKQVLTGPAMIADMPIYRFDPEMGEYYVSFSASEIEKIVRKFNAESRTAIGINYMHQADSQVSSAVIFEQWIVEDPENDKSAALGFKNVPKGSFFVSVHIADPNFWEAEVKTGNVRGFSIEGFLNLEMKKIKKDNMTKIKMAAEIKTVDGVVLSTPADAFVEGSAVFIVDAEGVETAAADGDLVLENGATITILDGVITAVVEAVPEEEQATALALSPEDIAAIDEALNVTATFADYTARIAVLEEMVATMATANAALTASNLEMAAKFAALPGSPTFATDKDDNEGLFIKRKQSFEDKYNAIVALKTKKTK